MLDASVMLAILLPEGDEDPAAVRYARAIVARLRRGGDLRAVVPRLWHLEVASVLMRSLALAMEEGLAIAALDRGLRTAAARHGVELIEA